MSSPEARKLFEQALVLLDQGEVTQGVDTLEEAHRLDSQDVEVIGNLAWACIAIDRRKRSAELYEKLIELQPTNYEARYRLQFLKAEDAGFTEDSIRRLLDILEKSEVEADWLMLIELAAKKHGAGLAAQAAQRAAKLYPGNAQFAAKDIQYRSQARRERRKALAERLGARRVLKHLLGYRAVREMLLESSEGSQSQLELCMKDFYQMGSVQAVFPQTPPELRAEAFDDHWKDCKCDWFRWMQEQSGLSAPPSGRLLDVGAGPGFGGHHFLKWGYDVTALSGSDAELEECRRRGMETLKCDMHSIPIPSNSLKGILASHVLEHSIAPMVMLWEFRRLLEPGGLIYVNLPFPNDGEPREHFPSEWDEETDTYTFETDDRNNGKIPEITYYTYGFPPHIFVLTYWQWRWVFRQAGLEHVASAMDIPGKGIADPHEALANKPDGPLHWNQLFILRNP
ncbi:methyltransferase domain-containing protein [bacterium]|nr:methyltransferase domain-containing protein [bacterium]